MNKKVCGVFHRHQAEKCVNPSLFHLALLLCHISRGVMIVVCIDGLKQGWSSSVRRGAAANTGCVHNKNVNKTFSDGRVNEISWKQLYLTLPFLQDILNNLDSCDLEDDDLMLDVDLPEDPPRDKGQ